MIALAACAAPLQLGQPLPPRERVVASTEGAADAATWVGKAAYAEAVGDVEAASRAWAWVTRLDAQDPFAWVRRGQWAVVQGAEGLAASCLQHAEKLAPTLPAVLGLRARFLHAFDPAAAEPALVAAAQAGDHDAWMLALGLGPPSDPLVDAWAAATLPVALRETRGQALLGTRHAEVALRDLAAAFDHVPTPDRLVAWARAAAARCASDPVRDWLAERQPEDWGPDWAEAAAAARAARCPE